MKKSGLALPLILFGTAILAQAQGPDPRDSVILESKTVSGGLSGSPAFTIRVYITNKDSIAAFTLPVKIQTIAGSAFAVLDTPRTFDGTIFRLTSTLSNNRTLSDFTDGASPDSAIWASFWNPNNRATAEPPNSTRKAFWEIEFGGVMGVGQAIIDSAVIFDNRIGFVNVDGNSVGVHFQGGIVSTTDDFDIVNCFSAGASVLHGRPYSYDFDAFPGEGYSWLVVTGPGSINSNGVYSFSGQCPLGQIPVTVQATSQGGTIARCDFILNVFDNAPTCSPAQNTITVSHGETATNQFNGSDPDAGDGVVFSKLSGPGTVGADGAWSYQTSCADVGFSPQFVRALAIDSFGSCWPGPESTSCLFGLVVTNAAPSITNCPTDVLPVDTGQAFSLQLTASDADPADAGNLLFFLVSGPVGFSVSSSGLVQWTPAGSQWGLRSATVQVRDLCGATTNCQIDFAVSVRKGDLNADGGLTPADMVYILNCIILSVPPPVGMGGCDLNCDGNLSPADVVWEIYAAFSGLPFPC